MKPFLFALLALLMAAATAAEEASIPLPSGENLGYTRYPAKGRDLLLWFASERGLAPAETAAAQELAAHGTEVWQFDLAAALFLPQSPSSMDGIAPGDVRAIFRRARETGARLQVYAVSRAAVPVLRALAGEKDLAARVMLMHPNFYASVDALVGAEYMGFGNLQGTEVLILQPRRSAATPWVDNQREALQQQGADVQVLLLDNVREGYWVRETATDFEVAEGKRLAERIMAWKGLFR